jgi:hypothetical protein
MKDPNEINPKNTFAPESDNISNKLKSNSLSDTDKTSIVNDLLDKLRIRETKSNLGNVTVTIVDGSKKPRSPSGIFPPSTSGSSFISTTTNLVVNSSPKNQTNTNSSLTGETANQTKKEEKKEPVIENSMRVGFEKLLESQDSLFKKFEVASSKMEQSWKEISSLKAEIFKIEETGEGIDQIEKLRLQLDRAVLLNKLSSDEANAIQSEIKDRQTEIETSLTTISEQSSINADVARKLLGVTKNASEESLEKLREIDDRINDDNKKFESFMMQFKYENELTRKVEDEINSRLDKSISDAVENFQLFTNQDTLVEISKKTGLNLETLALIQEEIANSINSAGDKVDLSDKKEVERFKQQIITETKFKNDIVKELIKSREKIDTESVKKELKYQYERSGLPAAFATIKAKQNAEQEANLRRKAIDEQIQILKTQNETEKKQLDQSLFQSSLIEEDIRYRLEKEKEDSGLPKWYRELREKLEPIKTVLDDMLEAYKSQGILTKILMALGLVGGIIAGVISAAISKVFSTLAGAFGVFSRLFPNIAKGITSFLEILSKSGTIGSKIISPIIKMVKPVITAMKFVMNYLGMLIKPLGAIFNSFKVGVYLGKELAKGLKYFIGILGKLALPITVLLTAIDAVIGGFKGYSKEGVSGIIKGALSGIISGLTFGLIDFESIFKFFGDTIQPIFDSISDAVAPFADWLTSTYRIFKKAFDDISETFQGGGSLIYKIFKSFGHLAVLGLEYIKNNIMLIVKGLFQLAVALPFKIGVFLGETLIHISKVIRDTIDMAINWFINWISSGQWLGDMRNFGNWIWNELVGVLEDAIKGLADGLGELPIVGEYIKQAIGGGSKSAPPMTQEEMLSGEETGIERTSTEILASKDAEAQRTSTEILASKDAEAQRTSTEIAKEFGEKLNEDQKRRDTAAVITLNKLIGNAQSSEETLSKINNISSTTERMASSYAAENRKMMTHEAMIFRSFNAISNTSSKNSSAISIEDSTKIKNISKELVREVKTSENFNASKGNLTSVNTTMVNNNTSPAPQPALIAPQPPRNTEPTYRNMMFAENPGF